MDNDALKNALRYLGERLSLAVMLEMVTVLVVAWGVVWLLGVVLNRLAAKFKKYRMEISRLFPILRIAIWTFAIGLVVFGILNPSENLVLALGATAGVAVGLAAQDLMKNVMAGLLMLFDRPFQVGDMVRIGGHYGEVISLNLTSVRLRTFADEVVTIPPAEVLKQGVSNSNAGELTELVAVTVHLPATVDVQAVKHLAWEAAAGSPYAYLKKPISVIVEDSFDYTFLTRFVIKAYVVDVRLERLFASDITERLKTELLARRLLTAETVDRPLSVAEPQPIT